jgi:hypothetical protein
MTESYCQIHKKLCIRSSLTSENISECDYELKQLTDNFAPKVSDNDLNKILMSSLNDTFGSNWKYDLCEFCNQMIGSQPVKIKFDRGQHDTEIYLCSIRCLFIIMNTATQKLSTPEVI